MTVTSVDKDLDSLTITIVARFEAPIESVWQLWADPRKLERWWGPPGYPATVEEHDLTPGGDVTYYMTSPEGDRYRGWWRVSAVDPPRSLEVMDGFADSEGRPVEDMPTASLEVVISEEGDRTRMELRSVYESREHMEKIVSMGAVEGITAAMGQIEAILAE